MHRASSNLLERKVDWRIEASQLVASSEESTQFTPLNRCCAAMLAQLPVLGLCLCLAGLQEFQALEHCSTDCGTDIQIVQIEWRSCPRTISGPHQLLANVSQWACSLAENILGTAPVPQTVTCTMNFCRLRALMYCPSSPSLWPAQKRFGFNYCINARRRRGTRFVNVPECRFHSGLQDQAAVVPVPLFRRAPVHNQPLQQLYDWRHDVLEKIEAVGNGFEVIDGGPSGQELQVAAWPP